MMQDSYDNLWDFRNNGSMEALNKIFVDDPFANFPLANEDYESNDFFQDEMEIFLEPVKAYDYIEKDNDIFPWDNNLENRPSPALNKNAPVKPSNSCTKQTIVKKAAKKADTAAKETFTKGDKVRDTWFENLSQITKGKCIPSRRCFYRFQNGEDCAWSEEKEKGVYIFELHLLQVLEPQDAWSFKRYVECWGCSIL